MAKREQPDIGRQAALMDSAEKRKSEYLRNWLKHPYFRAALHEHDADVLSRDCKDGTYAA